MLIKALLEHLGGINGEGILGEEGGGFSNIAKDSVNRTLLLKTFRLKGTISG